jgi:PAS domain S-box-containing protein
MSIRRKQMLIIMGTSSVVLLLACAAFSIYEVITFRKAMVQNLSALAEMVGDNTAAALGKTDFDLFGSEHASEAFADEQRIIATGQPIIDKEEREDWKDGRVTWVSSTKMPLLDKAGKIIGIMGISRDITERKRAEESLRLLGSAVEQAEDSIQITDAQLDMPGPRLLFVNPAFTKMTGYTAEEVLGKTPRILYGERTDKAVLTRLWAALARGETFHSELVNYRKDGSEYQAEMHIAPIRDAKGAITHFVAIKRDVTERRRFEECLFQSQKMETVGKLAGGVAHEFNSIMTAILGQAELMLFDLPVGNPLRKNASEIHHAADRAAILTRQLLAYGRKQMLQPDVLDLNAILAGMENTLRHIAGRDVDVHIATSAGPKLVKADPGQIEQVIVNIVMNAADAMPHGGKLTLETAETSLDQQYVSRFADLKPGEYVMAAITDTGPGMSEAVKARIFEPFFTTKEVGKGTGLGLATCHGIIKQSEGHINVYSEPGRGATFKIYLPKVRMEARAPGPPLKAPGMPRGTETILLVEDDPALRQMAATLLGRLGYTVLTAGNGLEALNVTHQRTTGHIDLLFTDVVMPHMSGKELADRVRSLYPQTNILFTSAYTENAFIHQGVLQPGITLLQKPFTPSSLAAKVREVLDSDKTAAAR